MVPEHPGRTSRTARSHRLVRRSIALTVLVAVALLGTGLAWAGRLHPDVAAKLATLPPGGRLAVIVELTDQEDPRLAAAPHRGKRAKLRAVVDALRDKANRTQGPLRSLLASEQAAGRAHRLLPLWIKNGLAVTTTEGVIRALAARADVREVRLDRVIPLPTPVPADAQPAVTEVSEWNLDVIRAPDVWAIDPAYTGVGSVVGSFDTGVDGTHPDLAPNYRGNDAISWFDPYGEHESPFDGDGHGTHTTGTAVGGSAGGTNIGVAPGAQWIAAKGWDDNGVATVSAFHQIFQWFMAPGGDPANAPDVVNMSWSFAEEGCLLDFLADVQALRAAGIFPSFAAGNSGPFPGSVSSPGTYPESFATGATDIFDEVPYFSGRGPSPCDGTVKPNLSAPGDSITSSVPWGYDTFSGTSMAAPHVTGAVAVLRAIDPTLTVEELEQILVQGAIDLGDAGPDNDFGSGRLDLFQSAQIALGGGGPDQPRVTIVATTPTATEAGLVAGAFTVTRTGPTDAELVVKYSVNGTATAGTDYVALPGTVTIPVDAASATIVVTPIDDPTVELDETVVVSLKPDPAYFVAVPGRATVTVVSDEIPSDMVVTLSVPATAAAGDTITVTDTTRNQGGGPSEPSTTKFYLSTNGILDIPGDTLVGSRTIPALAPGAVSVGSTSVTIPSSAAAGTYYVFAVADADGVLLESNESNNTTSASIQVGPDLVVAAVSAPSAASPGATITVTDTTRNLGAGNASASTTRFYLSTNPVYDEADVPLGSRAVPSLGSGASSGGSTQVTIPTTTAAGPYYLVARADADGTLAETNEFNNTASTLVMIGADLVVSALTVPTGAGAGASISITDTTKNQGSGTAPASTTRFYLSADVYWNPSDAVLGSRAVPALGAGESSTASTTVTIPAGATPGSYYILARADADGVVAETNENNNIAGGTLEVGSDLVITGVMVPSAAGAGQVITVTDITKNQGAGSAPASTTRLFLSIDGILDAADPVLGSRAVPALGAGESSAGSTLVTIPAATPAGTYYIFARADDGQVAAETNENNNRSFGTIQVGGDLVVSPLAVPGTAGAGAAITVTDTTLNQGGGSVVASTTRFYLSSDVTWDAGDLVLGSRAIPALAAGASSSGSTVVTIPASTVAGTYYVLARADADGVASETVETNNMTPRAIMIGGDLVISALSAPVSAGAGATITVTDTTRNQGAGALAASTTRVYFSANSALDAGDTQLGSRAVPALASGASSSGGIAVTIPAGTAAGIYYLIAVADADGVVPETIESNNQAVTAVQVGGDLVVSALLVPATAGAGGSISVTDTTTNQGSGGTGATTTRFYLSADATLDGGDLVLGSRAVPALASGTGSTLSTTLTIPAGVAGGTWFVIAQADADGAVSETLEWNNATARSIQIGGDLVVTAVSAPATAGAGLSLTVTDTTKNQGGGPVAATTTSLYLSTNTGLDGGDVWLASRAVPALGAGATSTASTVVTIPAGTLPGTYYVLAQSDAMGVVGESQEANNTGYAAVQVGPDLSVLAPMVPGSAGPGVTISVTDTTRNQGGGEAGASTTSFYLSTNPYLDAGDVFLGSRSVPALAAGASSTGSTSVTIPAGTPAGQYYVIAVADGGQGVAESQEGNNTSFTAVQLGSDLLIAWIIGPSAAGAGASFTVTEATKNAGGGPVPATTTAFYLSTNTSLDAADVFLGSRAVPALAGGAVNSASTVLVIPANVAPGPYYVLAKADADGVVSEGQEGNNVNYEGLVVGPDLAVWPSGPASAAGGSTITISDTTRNFGGGLADPSTTTFYLSNNSTLDGLDLVLGSRAVPAIAAGGSSFGSTSVTLPAGLAPGTYYLFARADAGGVVAESYETNNTNYTTIQITP
jgi:large repetitive protein